MDPNQIAILAAAALLFILWRSSGSPGPAKDAEASSTGGEDRPPLTTDPTAGVKDKRLKEASDAGRKLARVFDDLGATEQADLARWLVGQLWYREDSRPEQTEDE